MGRSDGAVAVRALGTVAHPMDRSRSLLPHALLAGAVLLLAVLGWPVAAHAATARVDVESYNDGTEAFRPKETTVRPGDTVRWVWTANQPHTVRFDPVPGPEGGDGSSCLVDCGGHTYTVTFPELGDFPYTDHVTGATGVVHVVEPEPDPTTEDSPESEDPGSGDTGETTEPDGQQTSSPTDDEDDDTTSGSGSETTDDGSSSSGGTAAAPRSGTSGSVGADVVDRETPEANSEGPAVAAAEPDFLEEFPEPQAPTPSEDVGEVALPDDSGGAGRTVWGTIGGLTLLGTIGAFGRVVLVGDPWSA